MGDLVGGHVSMMFLSILPVLGHVRSVTPRALAVTNPEARSSADVPTISESRAVRIFRCHPLWAGGAGGTPRPIIDRLSAELQAALGADVPARAARRPRSAEPLPGTPEDDAAEIDREE